ncbi:MAG: SgcJ/EcaC family oxidoreductase [Acidobacteriota bacterium]
MSENDPVADEAAIREVLSRYESALNASDADAVMQLYTEDGVFMPQHAPSAVGSEAVRQAYDGVFSTIRLSVRFDIAEVEPMSSEWAFARTNSAGTVTFLADGTGGPEANQELFLFRRTASGAWKIARYCFSTTNPPRA